MKKSIEEQKAAIDYSLTNRKPSDGALVDIETIREAAKLLGHDIAEYCPDGRNKSLAITKLEEAVMWAVKSIVLDEPL